MHDVVLAILFTDFQLFGKRANVNFVHKVRGSVSACVRGD
jgi:hypothetical protein